MVERRALGKGLGALIPTLDNEALPQKDYLYCPIEEIQPNKYQPRQTFDQKGIEELAASIKEKGVIQPLVVRRKGKDYELIMGERRWRAAQKAGLKEVPVIVKEAEDNEVLELSLIENIQREDLNPLEEARAYKQLLEEFALSAEELGKRVGKDRTTITNYLRLLKLPPEIKEDLAKNLISMGHARTFLSLTSPQRQKEAYRQVLRKKLSVRQTEALVKRLKRERERRAISGEDIQLSYLEEELKRWLGTQVKIRQRKEKGKIEIEFYSFKDLERIIQKIKGGKEA